MAVMDGWKGKDLEVFCNRKNAARPILTDRNSSWDLRVSKGHFELAFFKDFVQHGFGNNSLKWKTECEILKNQAFLLWKFSFINNEMPGFLFLKFGK